MVEPRQIAIFGMESTGKTALAQRLAAHFGEPWAEEFVREFWHLRDGRITGEDLGTIALGQIANEDRALAGARRAVFFDTTLLACVVWDDLLFPGDCPPWVRAEAERRARQVDLWLLCDTDLPFEPDPVRCFPDAEGRERGRRLCRDALVSRGLPLVDITGAGVEREARAIAAVEAIFPR